MQPKSMKRWRGGEERGGKGKERRGKERTGEARGGKEKKGSQRGEAAVQRQLGGGLINLKGGDLLAYGLAGADCPRGVMAATFCSLYFDIDQKVVAMGPSRQKCGQK